MTMANKLEGKKVIVAGGSRGIGKELVLEMARQGAHILFTYVSNEVEARATEAEARGISPFVVSMKADIGKKEDMDRVFDFIPANFGGNADIYIGVAFPESVFMPTAIMSESGFDNMFKAVRGHYFALQKAAQSLNHGGKIIVFSSGAAAMPQPGSGAYAGAKSAIEKFALSLARETGPQQITVNVVSPGVTKTEGLVAPKEMVDMLLAQTPLGRLGTVQDIAKATVQLCLPEMSWINGQVIQINGGIL
jgi:3-oxoacyl-[acyl-carrier protein] reductase